MRLEQMGGRSLPSAFAIVVLLAAPARANSIRVTRDSAAPASRFGLALELDDPATTPPTDAYVGIGPERGLGRQAGLRLRLLMDVSRLKTLARGRNGVRRLEFLSLLQDRQGPVAPLTLFLEHSTEGWQLGALAWDDSRGGPVSVGRCSLRSSWQRLEIEWLAGSESRAGEIRVSRVEDGEEPEERDLSPKHEGDDSSRTILFERSGLANADQSVSFVRLGVVARTQPAGLFGTLALDDFEVGGFLPEQP